MATSGSLDFLQGSSGLQRWISSLTIKKLHHLLGPSHRKHLVSLPSLDMGTRESQTRHIQREGMRPHLVTGVGGWKSSRRARRTGGVPSLESTVCHITPLHPQPHTCSIYTDVSCCHVHSLPSGPSHILFPPTRASFPVF